MSTDESQSTSAQQTARVLQRTALVLLGGGFLVTVAAAGVIGQRVADLESTATAVHRTGMLVLLAGFCLLLGSYRVPQVLDWLQRRGLTDGRRHVPMTWRTVFCSGESLMLVGVLGGLIAMFAVPQRLGIWIALVLAVLTPAMLTVTLVYTTGWRRAFCIGALFPAGVALLCAVGFANPVVASISRYGFTDSEFLRHFKVLIAGCLVLMFVAGCLAVALVLLLTAPRRGQDAPR